MRNSVVGEKPSSETPPALPFGEVARGPEPARSRGAQLGLRLRSEIHSSTGSFSRLCSELWDLFVLFTLWGAERSRVLPTPAGI